MRCEQLNVDKSIIHDVSNFARKSIVEKHEAFHSEMQRAQIGAVNSPAALFLDLRSAALVVPRRLVGDGEKLDPLVPDASWAAIPTR